MDATVRNGYVVFYRQNRYEAGSQIPASILPEVMKNQSWKVEVRNGKQEGKEGREEKEESERTESHGEKGQEIKVISADRMISKSRIR